MSGEDAASLPVRRMLPSVSEVLKELTSRAPVEPNVAFRVAREVCAEELKRIRDVGGESVPLEDLVQRALLRASREGQAPVRQAPPAPIPPPVLEAEAAPEPPAHGAEQTSDDPFSETAGGMDLRWDGDAREPFSEPQAVPVVEVDAAGPVAAEEVLSAPVVPTEDISFAAPAGPPPFALPADEDGAAEGPGDETLSRLSREAESIDLNTVFPKTDAGPVPFALSAEESGGRVEVAAEPSPPPFEDDEDTVLTIPQGGRSRDAGGEGGPRVGLILATALGLAALAGLGYLLVGLWVERDAAPPPVAVSRKKPSAVRSPLPTAAPMGIAEATRVTGPPLSVAATSSTGPMSSPGPGPVALPEAASGKPPSSVTALAGRVPTAVPTTAPTVTRAAIPTMVPTATPLIPRTRPGSAAVLAPAPAPVSIAPTATASGTVPVRQSRDGLVVTKDRAGQPQIFSIHFTSYKDRASAERDLRRLSALVGLEGYVAEVDLGEKGVWQRVMLGRFATAQEAKAAREELAGKGTRDMGWVYRVVGPEAAERR